MPTTHCERLDAYMQASDLKIVTILERERNQFNPSVLDFYTSQPHVDGCFYLDYAKYDYYGGKIVWSNGKPAVSAKFNLWDGFDTPNYIAQKINQMSNNPALPSSYSFVNVHPWSKSLADVRQTINLFNSDVEVVTPEVFMRRIIANVPHDPSTVDQSKSFTPIQDFKLAVYPNPISKSSNGASSMVTLRIEGADRNSPRVVRIVDVLGRTVREWRPEQEGSVWSINWDGRTANGQAAPYGIYFLQAIGYNSNRAEKFVIVR